MTRSRTPQASAARTVPGAKNPAVAALGATQFDRPMAARVAQQVPAPQFDPLLKPPQAAALLGVEVGTLEVWRSTKRYPLAFVKVGRAVRYRLSAINAFLAAGEHAA